MLRSVHLLRHRLAATRVDVISNMLLHLADSNTNLDVIGTEIVSVLCEDTVCQQLICTSRSGEQLYRILYGGFPFTANWGLCSSGGSWPLPK